MAHPALSFGSGLLGMDSFTNAAEVNTLLTHLQAKGVERIDTAARYPPINPGMSEKLLGDANAAQRFFVNTKILLGAGDGSGELNAASIDASVKSSMERLQVNQINLLYCHREDPKTPLEETLAEIDRQHRVGNIKEWGVCRFSYATLASILSVCEQHGYVKPSAYQGEYNAVTRGMESLILSLIRQHGLRFEAHRPLAAGFLSGKFTAGNTTGTRFGDEFPFHELMRSTYDHADLHESMRALVAELQDSDISPQSAALRWLLFHSALQVGDTVIFSASKLEQIDENVASVKAGPLPQEIAVFMTGLWEKLKGGERATLL